MKKLIAALAAGIVALALGACSTTQQADASAKLAQLQQVVANGCMVVQPSLIAAAAIDPTISVAATANGLFCATAGAINVASTQTLVSTGIPAIEKAVTDSALIPAEQKPLIVAALGVFQLTVANALMVYDNAQAAAPASAPAVAPDPASGPVVA
jgi:hypothetical protein